MNHLDEETSKNVRIGILSATNPLDKLNWSGTLYYMTKALKNEFDVVEILGPIKLSKFAQFTMLVRLNFMSAWHKFVLGGKFNRTHNHIRSKYHSAYFDKKIKQHPVDVILAIGASVELAHLKTEIPICYFSDSTFASMHNYYEGYKKLTNSSLRISNEIEQLSINNATTNVHPSQWASDSAKTDYHAKNLYIAKLGANIDYLPSLKDISKNYHSTIQILFVGVEWKRKGGDLALSAIDILAKSGYDIHFTVCGCVPPVTHPNMTVIPFLNKNKKEDMQKFHDLFLHSHLFFVPTRAECYGIVFCEANAFGLPVITNNTGGVSTVIENNINGFALPNSASSEEYAAIISQLIDDPIAFEKLAKSARATYENELNWTAWGKSMKKILMDTISLNVQLKK